jgi:transcriptional regulator with XRE-family HTH domain
VRSEGSRLLGAVEMTQIEIARRVGVRQPTVAGWISGEHTPKPKFRKTMQVAFGIPFSAWPVDDEVEELRAAVHKLADEIEAMRAEMKFVAHIIVSETKASPEVLARIADSLTASLRR